MKKPFLTIAKVAKLTGFNPKTIRYYEQIGLIPKPKRTQVPHGNGYRIYSDEDVRRLTFVKQAKLLDLSLRETHELLAAAEEGCCTSMNPKLGLLIEHKLGEIDTRLAELEALRSSLTRLQQQFKGSLIKPQKRQNKLVLFHVPCRDDSCDDGKT